MAKFNTVDKRGTGTRAAPTSPIQTETVPSTTTHQGGPGYVRDAKSELFLLAVSNMVAEKTFYEDAGTRDARYVGLIQQVAVADGPWTLRFLRWLRGEANMRSAALVGAAEMVKARLAAKLPSTPAYDVPGLNTDRGIERAAVDAVLQRADEPGEMLGYWTSTYGRNIPKPIKRGIADAVQRLYSEFSLLKYDTDSHGFRFADVLDLVHPTAKAPWQADLYRLALARRHGRAEIPEVDQRLPMVLANTALRSAGAELPELLLDTDRLRAAGMTWEDALSLVGNKVDKARLWEALIPSMGYMALLRNLRNFDEAGVSDQAAAKVGYRLADSGQVAKSRQLPMRFLSAYREAPSMRWAVFLEAALGYSLANVPALPGRTLILVDVSWSMYGAKLSARSKLDRAGAAKIFGAALALRAESPTLVAFSTDNVEVKVPKAGAVLRLAEQIPDMQSGTNTAQAVSRRFAGHDRVVIVTDEQAHYGQDPSQVVPAETPLYTWNLAGYKAGHGPSGFGTRHTFGGLSDAAFRIIPLLEAGRSGDWPF